MMIKSCRYFCAQCAFNRKQQVSMFTKESVKNYIKRLFTYVITIITARHRTELKIVHGFTQRYFTWFYTKIYFYNHFITTNGRKDGHCHLLSCSDFVWTAKKTFIEETPRLPSPPQHPGSRQGSFSMGGTFSGRRRSGGGR